MRSVSKLLLSVGLAAAFLPAMATAHDSHERRCHGFRITLRGTPTADTLEGTAHRDVIDGRAGDDRIIGNDGNDVICGGAGRDHLDGRYGKDEIFGDMGDDKLAAGPGADLLDGGTGDDTLQGQDGQDTMVGGKGRDFFEGGSGGSWIFGGDGNDIAHGGSGYDRFFMGNDDDYVDGGDGEDLVSYRFSSFPVVADLPAASAFGEGNDLLYGIEDVDGSAGDDKISGGGLDNKLAGLDGNDQISGGEGRDTIDGGRGDDELDGASDNDTVSFASSAAGVEANLATGSAAGDGSDTLAGFENITGSPYQDDLTGDDGANNIEGWTDSIHALGGSDTTYGGTGDAGEGDDTCWNSNLSNCEHFGVIDFAASPAIFSPTPNQTRSNVRRIRGGTKPGLSPPYPPDTRIFVSLRLLTPEGCYFWAHRGGLIERPCDLPAWHRAKGTTNDWTFRLKGFRASGPLPPGPYEAVVGFRGSHLRAETAVEFSISPN